MLAAYADDPLSGPEVGEIDAPSTPEGWVTVDVRAAALNHHDVWSLRGVGLPADRLPMILGCDAAGTDPEGNEVLVHSVIPSPGWAGDETLDPRRSLLSEVHPGTLAEQVRVPARNLVPKPAELSWEQAACLPTAWLTAYRMLFTNAGVQPGDTVLVQGAAGGVATALVQLGSAAGLRMWSGDLVALGELAAPRWTDRHLGRHERRRAGESRTHQDLLQAAAGHRVHHGHP